METHCCENSSLEVKGNVDIVPGTFLAYLPHPGM
jgi:hypothetical protein